MSIEKWKNMMSEGSKNTPKVIVQLIEILQDHNDSDYLNDVIRISSRQKDLKKQIVSEELTDEQARILQNKINKAILFTLDELADEGILGETENINTKSSTMEADPIATASSSEPTIEELKKKAKDTQHLLFSLQNEKEMTQPGKAEVILKKQIEATDQELNELKSKIQALLS